jgi:lipoate-protein ligase A
VNQAVRVIDTDLERPQLTAAIDEALLESRIDGRSGNTIHLYRRRPPSVSIGYFQSATEVADLEACRQDDVPVVRRISGGGAIYTDERQLVYALTFRPQGSFKAQDGLHLACNALVRALGHLGVEGARMEGLNDVVVGDNKISGSAQVIRRGVHLVHGTVLVDTDLEAMAKYLLVQPAKQGSRGHVSPATRVGTLAQLMTTPPTIEDVKACISRELAFSVGGAIEEGVLLDGERDQALHLEATRYTQDEWNLRT